MSSRIDIGKLRAMKYNELRALAKAMSIHLGRGVKGEKLITAILEKVDQASDLETSQSSQTDDDNTAAPSYCDSKPSSSQNTADVSVMQHSSTGMKTMFVPDEVCSPPVGRRIRRNTYELTSESVVTPISVLKSNTPEADKNTPLPSVNRLRPRKRSDNTPHREIREARKKNEKPEKREPEANENTPLPVSRLRPRKRPDNTPHSEICEARKKNETVKTKKNPLPSRIPQILRACATPDFKGIHERAFKKMDSIDVYLAKKQHRREMVQMLSRKSVKNIRSIRDKMGKPKEIPGPKKENPVFQPSVLSTQTINMEFGALRGQYTAKSPFRFGLSAKNPDKIKSTVKKESQFNVKESLSRKLKYLPHKGPVKPFQIETGLCDRSTFNVSSTMATPLHSKQMFSTTKRDQERGILKGVRLNRRFSLQLKLRGISIDE